MTTQPYDPLAKWFEFLNDDCDYPKWSQYFIAGLARLGAGRRGLELGCGSGAFCRALARQGYAMTGADCSERMLTVAAQRAAEEGLAIPFVRADARRLRTPQKYDFILSPNDCFNYLRPAELPAAFSHVAASLVRGGIFWFDVSAPCKLREKVANNMFADDRDEVTYLAFSYLFADRVELDVTLFEREADGRFSRTDARHVQYIHGEEALLSALAAAHFEVCAVEGHLGAPKEGSDRWNFLCKRA